MPRPSVENEGARCATAIAQRRPEHKFDGKCLSPTVNEACTTWGKDHPDAGAVGLFTDCRDTFQVATKRAAMRVSKVIEDVNDAAKLAKRAAAGGLQDGQSPIEGIKIGITHVDPACCQNVDGQCQTDPAKWTYGTAIDGPFGRFSSSHRRAGCQDMVVVMGFLPSAIKETLSGWGHAFTVELFLHENPLGFDLGTFNGKVAKVDGKVDSKPGGKWMSKDVAVVY